MKVQDVKKECLANVGLSIEFSNSEIDSITHVVLSLNETIERGCANLADHALNVNQINSEMLAAGAKLNELHKFDDPNKMTVSIDLKTLIRVAWLLDKITNYRATKPSALFDEVDCDIVNTVHKICGNSIQEPI